MGGRKYTEEEIAYIKANYANEYNSVLAKKLGRSISAINNMSALYGLYKSHAFKVKQGKQAAEAHYDELSKTWFAKGSVPFNKGRKQSEFMSEDAIARTKLSRFAKGQEPANTLHDGAITWRKDKSNVGGYYHIRLRKSYWVLLHRHLWEQAHGPIPKGYNVQFKDGNSRNCVLENLELVDKKGNMLKNTIHQWPEPIKENIKLINKINKKIKTYEQQKQNG